jgi:hypothetical protein
MTNEAVADLKFEKGKQAYAVGKASDGWSASTDRRLISVLSKAQGFIPRSAP